MTSTDQDEFWTVHVECFSVRSAVTCSPELQFWNWRAHFLPSSSSWSSSLLFHLHYTWHIERQVNGTLDDNLSLSYIWSYELTNRVNRKWFKTSLLSYRGIDSLNLRCSIWASTKSEGMIKRRKKMMDESTEAAILIPVSDDHFGYISSIYID